MNFVHAHAEAVPARHGFECQSASVLADWRSIAERWDAGLERTVARCGGHDAPFCHSEDGNMHALMAGAEMAGWSTLREVSGNRGDAESGAGYLDGCFVGDASIDLVEAKHLEFKVSAAGELRNSDFAKLQNRMRGAANDADVYFNRHKMFAPSALPKRRIGVLFCSGHLEEDSMSGSPWLESYLAKLREIDHDVMTWSFPSSARGLRYWSRHYPGVVMLVKLARTEPAVASQGPIESANTPTT
jgi:hypothetical protein